MADESCGVFQTLDGNLDPERIHRMVVGEDAHPRAMSQDEARKELGDPFATLMLLKGNFPRTGEETVEGIRKAAPKNSPLRDKMVFLVGEASQIPAAQQGGARLSDGTRFIVAVGANPGGPPEGPDVIVSTFAPDSSDIELMAWDDKKGGFNYYRAVGSKPVWVFAGNAAHALTDPTQGKGPFESHRSGAFLMKELKKPWVHWHSDLAIVTERSFPDDDGRTEHPWFEKKEETGAYTLEPAVARPAIERWANVRFGRLAATGKVERPRRIMRQLLGSPTANIASSNLESALAKGVTEVDLPPSFFANVDWLAGELGLAAPQIAFSVKGEIYRNALEKFNVRLEDRRTGFVRKGDTHFAFAVLEPAFEDQVALRGALRIGLVTRRLAASLLMVDFPNAIFSDRRAKLLDHVPAHATIKNGKSSFSQKMADAILGSPEAKADGTAEHEFAARWNVGTKFERPFNALLRDYYAVIAEQLKSQNGFNNYLRLANFRRSKGRREMPIFAEFGMTFPVSDIQARRRSMRIDGTVA
ncbi:MAG: hypothetical protein QOD24_4291 [Solirubrobacteraceae bacterium]|jgi:hypothetical protein|nr:hypothetical protein [Solirubrobacteraceae bacterium]